MSIGDRRSAHRRSCHADAQRDPVVCFEIIGIDAAHAFRRDQHFFIVLFERTLVVRAQGPRRAPASTDAFCFINTVSTAVLSRSARFTMASSSCCCNRPEMISAANLPPLRLPGGSVCCDCLYKARIRAASSIRPFSSRSSPSFFLYDVFGYSSTSCSWSVSNQSEMH